VLNARAWGVGRVRTVCLFPVLVAGTGGASVAVALLWLWVFNTRLGLLSLLLGMAHLPAQTWVFSDRALLPSLALMCLWTVGRSMLVYLAGLQGLPAEVLWSAQVDGASAWRCLRRVTLPLISPMLLFNLVLDVVQALQTFSQAYVVNQVAPSSPALSYLVYQYANAFTLHGMAYASVLAWILFAAMLGLTALILRSARRWAQYRGAAS
jgi:multiple sugar transport system permease protein